MSLKPGAKILRVFLYGGIMSAKTEKLLEQINRYKIAIEEVESRGDDSQALKLLLSKSLEELYVANLPLSEGKSVLKG